MPVLALFLCLFGNYFTYHSKGDLVKVEQDIHSQGELISTPVPNSGYLENIYFNTNLSVDVVVDLCSQLTFVDGGYGICLSEDQSFILLVLREGNIISIGNPLTQEYCFSSSGDLGLGFVGWNPDFNGIMEVNSNVVSVGSGGLQNDLISSLVSSTPFEYVDGELIRTDTYYLTFGEYEDIHYFKEKLPIKGQFIESFVISKNESLLYDLANSLNIAENKGITIFSYNNQFFNICNVGTDGDGGVHYVLILSNTPDTFDPNGYFIYCPPSVTDAFIDLGINAPSGFNINLSYDINSSNYFYNSLISDYVNLFSDSFYDYYETIFNKLSFFDISLKQTDNTFNKFQLPFLRNAFESVFNILEFETSYVSSFVLTSFTWLIQLLLLHVVVDTLAFIFKMYHKLMDKVV